MSKKTMPLGKAWQAGDEANSILMVQCAEVLGAFFRAFKSVSGVDLVCPLSIEDQFDELERLPSYTMLEAMTIEPSNDLTVTFRVQMGVVIRGGHEAPEGFAIDLQLSASCDENPVAIVKSPAVVKPPHVDLLAPAVSLPGLAGDPAPPAAGPALLPLAPPLPGVDTPAPDVAPPPPAMAIDNATAVARTAHASAADRARTYTHASLVVLPGDQLRAESIPFPMLSEAQQRRIETMSYRLVSNEPDGVFEQVDSSDRSRRKIVAIRLQALKHELDVLEPGSIEDLDVPRPFLASVSLHAGSEAVPTAHDGRPFRALLEQIEKWSRDETKSKASKQSMAAAAIHGASEAALMIKTTHDSVGILEALATRTMIQVREQLASGKLKRRWNKLDPRGVEETNTTVFGDPFNQLTRQEMIDRLAGNARNG